MRKVRLSLLCLCCVALVSWYTFASWAFGLTSDAPSRSLPRPPSVCGDCSSRTGWDGQCHKPTGVPWPDHTPRPFVLLTAPRSGSSLTLGELGSADDVVSLGELLNPSFVRFQCNRPTFGGLFRQLSFVCDLAEERSDNLELMPKRLGESWRFIMSKSREEGKAYGFKLFSSYVAEMEDLRVFRDCVDPDHHLRVIFLLRTNILASQASLTKAKNQRKWTMINTTGIKTVVPLEDLHEAEHLRDDMCKQAYDLDADMWVAYESIQDFSSNQTRRVFHEMFAMIGSRGVDGALTAPLARQQDPGSLRDDIVNIRELEADGWRVDWSPPRQDGRPHSICPSLSDSP